MPRPEQVIPRADSTADHGSDAQLKRLAAAVATKATTPGPGSGGGASPAAAQAQQADLNDGYDTALFAPTDRPNEPVTAGVPFGPGSNFVPQPFEDDRTFMLRVASDLKASPGARDLGPYIAKIEQGL